MPADAKHPLQFNDQDQLRHFISPGGLPHRLLTEILNAAGSFLEVGVRVVKEIPLLRGGTVCNVLFENSTRTRTTFELAVQRLSVGMISLNTSVSSTGKGETLTDTLRSLEAMAANMFVVRYSDSGMAHFIVEHVSPNAMVINDGDGCHTRPTQRMSDVLTTHRHRGNFEQLSAAIVGDILHLRVARSNVLTLKTLSCPDIHVITPHAPLPIGLKEQCSARVLTNAGEGLEDVDVVIMLHLQHERTQDGLLPSEDEFFRLYGLIERCLKLTKPDAIIMHPDPTNCGMEIRSTVANGTQPVILSQVTYDIAIRMTVLSMAMSGQNTQCQLEQEDTE